MNAFDLPRYVARILQTIEAAGIEAFLVGGCVRDLFLNRTPSDWDIASSAPPQEIMRIFEKTVPTGVKYGTVTVVCGDDKAEVTAYRSESGYGDYRRPSSVCFGGDIKTDLSRRDFTVNAIAFNPAREFIDPFDGYGDIKRQIIRAVGDPALRFEEDALRILRAYRFAAQLGFEVESGTLDAAREKAGLVAKISVERVKSELDRILMSERPQLSLALVHDGALDFLGLNAIETVKKEAVCHGFTLTPKTLAARWAAFFSIAHAFDADNIFSTSSIMGKLKFDTKTKDETLRFILEQKLSLPNGAAQIKKRLSTGFTPEQYEVYLKLRAALTGHDASGLLAELHRIKEQVEPYMLSMLAVNGGDILSLGAAPGPLCGKVLAQLLDKVIDDPSLNDKKTLICLAEQALRGH